MGSMVRGSKARECLAGLTGRVSAKLSLVGALAGVSAKASATATGPVSAPVSGTASVAASMLGSPSMALGSPDKEVLLTTVSE